MYLIKTFSIMAMKRLTTRKKNYGKAVVFFFTVFEPKLPIVRCDLIATKFSIRIFYDMV